MNKTAKFVCLLAILWLALGFGFALGDEGVRSEYTGPKASKFTSGLEEFNGLVHSAVAPSRLSPSRSVEGQPGITWYEYQHNGTMGRQISGSGAQQHIHFSWMRWEEANGQRHIAYNAYDMTSGNFAWNSGNSGGKTISGTNGGYTTIDVTSSGGAVIAFHEGIAASFYTIRAAIDVSPPLGFFDTSDEAPGPPTCEGWTTGNYESESAYIWPVVDIDMVDEDTIMHVVAAEWPPATADPGEIQTMFYYRRVNGNWPTCATAIDSVYSVTPVVRSDSSSSSDKVAIVWGKPMYYEGDANDPCGWTQWQNDIVYLESTDGGLSFINHTATFTNVTDYSMGGTLSPDQMEHQAYTDLSAMYDSEGNLHIVWSTPLRNLAGDTPCNPLYATRLWHWDSFNQCISLVYDASSPRFFCPIGVFNMSTAKMNVSECHVNDSTRFYVSFSRFGAHTSANGDTVIDCSDSDDNGNYANSDLFITGSSDGGLTWGPSATYPIYIDTSDANTGEPAIAGTAVNLSNTYTPDCLPGDCDSEHWSSMSKFNVDSVHIMYIHDRDAGAGIRADPQEGVLTENPVMYRSDPCFHPIGTCGLIGGPTEVDVVIAPEGGTDCTVPETYDFDVTLTNTGNQQVNYNAVSSEGWLGLTNQTGTIFAGCNNTATVGCSVGPWPTEGEYSATITVTANCAGGDDIIIVVDVRLRVVCEYYPPEHYTLSTACWSVDVWNTARAGGDLQEGQMYWFIDQVPLMFDESLIITYADDTCRTWFSIFDGSDSEVSLVPMGPLNTVVGGGFYEYAEADWASGDTTVTGTIQYYLPVHPDTCVLIERAEVCNGTDEQITIHVGEAIDWDVPDGEDGSNNQCGYDPDRQMLYQYGPPGVPEEAYHGGASFCHNLPGGSVFMNDIWVYPNSGYTPCEIGGYLARASSFDLAPADSIEDLNTVYAVDQNVVLDPAECVVYCKVKASSLVSLEDLQSLIDRGKQWIADNEIDCPVVGCPDPDPIGDANGSGGIDIDDVVYLIAYIFTGGPAPVPYPVASGDANCTNGVDIDDVVYLIAYIFTGGPPPCTCPEWTAMYGPLH